MSKIKEKPKRSFSTGAVRDAEEGKESYLEGVSWLAMKRFAKYMDAKSTRYGKGNWQKGIPIESYIESLLRHVQKFTCEWQYGVCEEKDDHLSAMVFNIFGILHELELHKFGKGRFPVSSEYRYIYPVEGYKDGDKTTGK